MLYNTKRKFIMDDSGKVDACNLNVRQRLQTSLKDIPKYARKYMHYFGD